MAPPETPLPPAAIHILLAIGPGERHGYAIMSEVATLTNGAVRLAPGTLYTNIKRLLASGLIEETDVRAMMTATADRFGDNARRALTDGRRLRVLQTATARSVTHGRLTTNAPPIATIDEATATAISTASACMSNITTPESTTAAIGRAPTINVRPTRRAWTVRNRPSAGAS